MTVDPSHRYSNEAKRDIYDDFKLKKPFSCDVSYKLIQLFKGYTVQPLNSDVVLSCLSQSVLREDVKEKFKYEVDRSSPSNKLREFMDWSKDIIQDIKYTRNVLSNKLSRFFLKYW